MRRLDDEEFLNSHYITFCTRKGNIKKTPLEAYSRPRQGGINAIEIGDALIEAKLTNGKNEIILAIESEKPSG